MEEKRTCGAFPPSRRKSQDMAVMWMKGRLPAHEKAPHIRLEKGLTTPGAGAADHPARMLHRRGAPPQRAHAGCRQYCPSGSTSRNVMNFAFSRSSRTTGARLDGSLNDDDFASRRRFGGDDPAAVRRGACRRPAMIDRWASKVGLEGGYDGFPGRRGRKQAPPSHFSRRSDAPAGMTAAPRRFPRGRRAPGRTPPRGRGGTTCSISIPGGFFQRIQIQGKPVKRFQQGRSRL